MSDTKTSDSKAGSGFAGATGYAPNDELPQLTEQAQATANALLINWVRERWEAEVKHRPLVNVNRRTLDDTWRQVIRYAGGDPVAILGPSHDEMLVAHNKKVSDAPDSAAPNRKATL